MKTQIAFGLAVVVGLGILGACDGGTAEDTDAGGSGGADSSGGTSSGSGGYHPGSGGTNSTGGAVGGEGGGGGGEPPELTEIETFCNKYAADCGFDGTDYFDSEAACLTDAADVKESNPDRWECFKTHLGYVAAQGASHCTHASGAISPCAESDFPL